jgi:hypothetical protein
MNAICATTTLRDAGLDAEYEGDAILVSCPWSPDTVTTVPVYGDHVEQWRIEDACAPSTSQSETALHGAVRA